MVRCIALAEASPSGHGLGSLCFVAWGAYDAPANAAADTNTKGTPLPAAYQIDWNHVWFDLDGSTVHWMAQLDAIHQKKLRYICLPATHDSGTYALQSYFTQDPSNPVLQQKAYAVIDKLGEIAKKIQAIDMIDKFINDPLTWVLGKAWDAIKSLSMAHSRSIFEQLLDGVRAFDLRVYRHDNDYFVGHGDVLGPRLGDIFEQIQYFLRATHGEVVYITLAHFTNFTEAAHYTEFKNLVAGTLGLHTYSTARLVDANGVNINDPFEKTWFELVAPAGNFPRSAAVLVWGMGPSDWQKYMTNSDNDLMFWPDAYCPPDGGITMPTPPPASMPANWDPYQGWPMLNTLQHAGPGVLGGYTDSEDPSAVFAQQGLLFKVMRHAAVASPPALAIYMTVTPAPTSTILRIAAHLSAVIAAYAAVVVLVPVVGQIAAAGLFAVAAALEIDDSTFQWHTLRDLTDIMAKAFKEQRDALFYRPNEQNVISLLYGDFYQDTGLVDFAIKLNSQCPVQMDPRLRITTQPQQFGWWAPDFPDAGWSLAADEGANGTAPWGHVGMPEGSTARWIWTHDSRNEGNAPGSVAYIRKHWLKPGFSSATLYMTADDGFTVYFNGNKVGEAHEWRQVQSFQLNPYYNDDNVLAIEVVNDGGAAGLLFDLVRTITQGLPAPRDLATNGADAMNAGTQLLPNQCLLSKNGQYEMLYQGDGNLVVYQVNGMRPLWASNTSGRPAYAAGLSPDGTLAVWIDDALAVWCATPGTTGGGQLWPSRAPGTNRPGAKLVMQDDGVLAAIDAQGSVYWMSNAAPIVAHGQNTLATGATLKPGDRLVSRNGLYQAMLGADGHFAVSRVRDGYVLFDTMTQVSATGVGFMDDGKLVVFTSATQVIWTANVNQGYGGHRFAAPHDLALDSMDPNGVNRLEWFLDRPSLVLGDDGNLLLIDSSGGQRWQSEPMMKSDRLTSYGQNSLAPFEKIGSALDGYQLIFAYDGTLLIRRVSDGAELYRTFPINLDACAVKLLPNGCLVIQTSDTQVVWTGPDGNFRPMPLSGLSSTNVRAAELTLGDREYLLCIRSITGAPFWWIPMPLPLDASQIRFAYLARNLAGFPPGVGLLSANGQYMLRLIMTNREFGLELLQLDFPNDAFSSGKRLWFLGESSPDAPVKYRTGVMQLSLETGIAIYGRTNLDDPSSLTLVAQTGSIWASTSTLDLPYMGLVLGDDGSLKVYNSVRDADAATRKVLWSFPPT